MNGEKGREPKQPEGDRQAPTPARPIDEASATTPLGEETERQAHRTQDGISAAAIVTLTRRLVFWTASLVFVGIITTVVLFLQFRTLDNTDQTLRDTLIVTQRPWITAQFSGVQDFNFDKDGNGHLNVAAIIKNVGHSVANRIAVNAILISLPADSRMFGEPVRRQTEICQTLEQRKPLPISTDLTLFPNDTVPWNLGLSISKTDIDAAILPIPEIKQRLFTAAIIGCIDYRFSFDVRHHQTRIAYALFRKLLPGGAPGAIIVGESIPAEVVLLERWFFGGNDAD